MRPCTTRVPDSLAGAVADASSGRVVLVEAGFRPFWATMGQYWLTFTYSRVRKVAPLL